MKAAIRASNAGQVRTRRQLSELIILELPPCENMEAAIRAYNAGQVIAWSPLRVF